MDLSLLGHKIRICDSYQIRICDIRIESFEDLMARLPLSPGNLQVIPHNFINIWQFLHRLFEYCIIFNGQTSELIPQKVWSLLHSNLISFILLFIIIDFRSHLSLFNNLQTFWLLQTSFHTHIPIENILNSTPCTYIYIFARLFRDIVYTISCHTNCLRV